jgi:hypothetical protein
MPINQRQFVRFSLDIPAVVSRGDKSHETAITQISLGGCFMDSDESLLIGDEFRMEIKLPNGNFLPLTCRAVYRVDGVGIGARFLDITEWEQELVSRVIEHHLDVAGVPLQVDPFTVPPTLIVDDRSPRIADIRQKRDSILQKIMSGS